nr:unnamed protein product [Callosobruchus analis]
MGSSSRRNVK